jgi:VanZ family protein
MRVRRVLPPLAWTAVITWLSTDAFSAGATGAFIVPLLRWLLPAAPPENIETIHWVLRKVAHVTEYGVLAALWAWALMVRDGGRRWLAPFGLVVLTAVLDETHQSFTRMRTANPADVVLDSAAAGAVLIWMYGGPGNVVGWLTTLLLWVAAAGGAALIALDWSAGVPAGWLWWSVPAACVALTVWHRRHRRS